MHSEELIHKFRQIWVKRVIQNIARGAGLREDFREQLDRFQTALEQVIDTGDPEWMDSILVDWAASLTQTDLEGKQSNLTQFVRQLFQTAYDVCRESFETEEGFDLIGSLIPAYSAAFERAAQFEMQTRVKYLTNQLDEVQESLEKLDKSKSDFIAVAAHELRTPLTLVEGYAAMLGEMFPSEGNSPSLELINGIHNGTQRLRTIIDDMIDVSLIDNNLMSLNYQPVWINRLLGVLKLELSPTLEERKQILEVADFPGSNEIIFADPERLLQVFRNLLLNSVKFTPDGGKINVDGKMLPGFLDVTVTDTGIGIKPEDQQYIFEKGGRLGNTALHSSGKTKFKGGGPGLGLHIAKGIIEAHGGAIWVESETYDEVNCPGSTFHILIPIRESPPDDKTAKLFAPLIPKQPKA